MIVNKFALLVFVLFQSTEKQNQFYKLNYNDSFGNKLLVIFETIRILSLLIFKFAIYIFEVQINHVNQFK